MRIPLTTEQFADIGRIVTMFGLIERRLDSIIMLLLNQIDAQAYGYLFDGRMLNNKCETMKYLAKLYMVEGDGLEHAMEICSELSALISERNHVVHGSWGMVGPKRIWPIDKKEEKIKADELMIGAQYERNPDNPLPATALSDLAKRTDEFSGKLLDFSEKLGAIPKRVSAGSYFVEMMARGHSLKRRVSSSK